MRRRLLVLAGLLVSASGGCGDHIDHRPATWSYISPALLQPNCATASCHSGAAAVAGLDLSDPNRGYKSLTGLSTGIADPTETESDRCRRRGDTIVCRNPFRPLVSPFNPAQSRLVHMLRARNATRMPPDRPLPEADIALIERWILNGAEKTPGDARSDASVDRPGDATVDARDAGGEG